MKHILRSYAVPCALVIAFTLFAHFAQAQSFPVGQATKRSQPQPATPKTINNLLQSGRLQAAPPNHYSEIPPASKTKCTTKPSVDPTTNQDMVTYTWSSFFPLWRTGCNSDAQINAFFATEGSISAVDKVQYIYNAQQSASIINADLLTATFKPGMQMVLAGSAVSGSGNSSGTSSGSGAVTRPFDSTGSPAPSTDSVATTVAKLESGGDFNLRFPMPLLWWNKSAANLTGQFTPNVGFNVNGLSAQNNITDSTQYTVNLPIEFYGQLNSTSGSPTAAILFFDIKPAGQFISKTLAAKLGSSVPTAMFLGQASAGVEIAQKVRVSLQYIYGNASIYQSGSANTSVAATTPQSPTTRVGGFHLAVSFSK